MSVGAGVRSPASRGPASRGSIGAVVLAAAAALGPLVMLVLFVAFTAVVPRSNIGLAVLVTMLAFGYEVAIGPIAAVISFVLALVARRRGGSSRRNSTIALTVLGVSVSLVVLQVLLYLPH